LNAHGPAGRRDPNTKKKKKKRKKEKNPRKQPHHQVIIKECGEDEREWNLTVCVEELLGEGERERERRKKKKARKKSENHVGFYRTTILPSPRGHVDQHQPHKTI